MRPRCGPARVDLCDADQAGKIGEFMALSVEDLEGKIKEKEDTMAASDEELKALLDGLNSQLVEARRKNDALVQDMKPRHSLLKSVHSHKKQDRVDL